MTVEIVLHNDEAHSVGALGVVADSEISIPFSNVDNGETAARLCENLSQYLIEYNVKLKDGDRVAWATSVLEFRFDGEMLSARSLDPTTNVLDETADRTLQMWRYQVELCTQNKSAYLPAKLEDFAVASPDLIDGKGRVSEAVRYPFLIPNCGWWLFGTHYRGSIESMRRVQLGEVVARMPEVARYLALEPGFCFRPSEARVWREAEVALREPI